MTGTDRFWTEILDTDGVWPEPPSRWSYSSIMEFRECPRRWMLRRASYPQIWDRRGYPDLPTLPSLMGDVMHRALEELTAAMVGARCSAAGSECGVQVMRDLGGFTALLNRNVVARLDDFTGNPRTERRRNTFEQQLQSQ